MIHARTKRSLLTKSEYNRFRCDFRLQHFDAKTPVITRESPGLQATPTLRAVCITEWGKGNTVKLCPFPFLWEFSFPCSKQGLELEVRDPQELAWLWLLV